MTKPHIENNVVTFSNGKTYEMPWVNEKYCHEYQGLIFLILGSLEVNSRNIWCFDEKGNKLWEIEPGIWESPYHDIKFDDEDRVRVYDQRGDTYALDIHTGYVEWIGGDRGGDATGANDFIRKRRNASLKE